MESPTSTPRPHPRFAGFETLVIMGAEAVVRGWTEGDTGLVVGGVLLLLLSVLGWLGWRRWGAAARQWFFRRWRPATPAREEEGADAGGVELGDVSPYLSPVPTAAPLPLLDGTLV